MSFRPVAYGSLTPHHGPHACTGQLLRIASFKLMENFRLRVFRTVARTLNFRAAAEELFLTQPAVSSQIKALEEELGTPLFHRSGGRVTLSPAGHTLQPFADQLFRLAQQATEAVAASANLTAGHLVLGASQTIAQYVLPRLLATFLQDHPGITFDLHDGNTQQILALLHEQRVQLALIEGPALSPDLNVTPFLHDELVLVVPAAHEWADQQIPATSLQHAPLLLREHGSGSRRVLEQALEDAGLPLRQLTLGLSFHSTEGLLNAVEAGLGVTFVSRWAVHNQLQLGTLKLARVQGLSITRSFSLARSAGPEPTGTAGLFVRFLLERARAVADTSQAPRRTASHTDKSRMNRPR